MKKSIYLLLSAFLIIVLLDTSCSSATTEKSSTPITTNSTTEINNTTITITTTSTTTLTVISYPVQANQILALLLKTFANNGCYTVVYPENKVFGFSLVTADDRKNLISYMSQVFTKDNYDLTNLAGMLFDINVKFKTLTLESSTNDGYYIDYDGKFQKYFQGDGGGGEKWHQEHPEANGLTVVSMPAYDLQTGLVLVYMGTQYDWLYGSGSFYFFKYTDGNLIKIDSVQTWIS